MQARSIVFTINNPTPDIELRLQSELEYRYLVIGREIGESGTPHLQGFCQLKSRTRLKKLGEKFPWHIESTKGTPKQASDYCKKDGDFIEFGELCGNDAAGDNTKDRWASIIQMARAGEWNKLSLEYPGEYIRNLRNLQTVHVAAMNPLETVKKCLWLYGEPGTGKSRFAHDLGKDVSYWKNPNKWWDNYKGDKVVILDDFDKTHEVLGYHLKRWADRYPVLCETKGGSIYPDYDILIVTSNYHPNEIFKDTMLVAALERRFDLLKVLGFEESLEGILSIKTYSPTALTDYVYINKFNYL